MRNIMLKDIVRELLVMMSETNPGFAEKCKELIEVIDSWPE